MSAREMPARAAACRIAFDVKATDSSGGRGNRMFATAILTIDIEGSPLMISG
jgi:hypothetical protein